MIEPHPVSQLNTPFKNPSLKEDEQEVKVIDPKHPLYGQTFHVVEKRSSAGGLGFVFVEYQGVARLYLALNATLMSIQPATLWERLSEGEQQVIREELIIICQEIIHEKRVNNPEPSCVKSDHLHIRGLWGSALTILFP